MRRGEFSNPRAYIFHELFHPRDAVTAMVLIIAIPKPLPGAMTFPWGCGFIKP